MNDEEIVQLRVEKHLWKDEKKKMRKQRNQKILLFVLMIALFMFGWVSRGFLRSPSRSTNQADERFSQMLDLMAKKWYYSTESSDIYRDLYNKAMKGMATFDYDPYTEYLSLEDLASFEQDINQTYTGIGVEMSTAAEYPLIIRVFYDSPAEKGGLIIGDYIVSVDGKDIKGLPFNEVKPLVVGEAGTSVKIGYEREGERHSVDLIRANISNTVYTKLANAKVGYIQISTFGSGTANEFTHALDEMKNQGVTGLIIDLRDNGGGYLDVLIRMADCFLEKDQIIFKQVYVNDEEIIYRATTNIVYKFDKIAILVNKNTASASEAFVSCLQDHNLAIVVGEKTYGKGTSQSIYVFSDGSALKYTQTHWYSALGKQINNLGVQPDYSVALPKILELPIPEIKEEFIIEPDSVSELTAYVQSGLQMMGYNIDRDDGYFSAATLKLINRFQKANSLKETAFIDNEFLRRFLAIIQKYYLDHQDSLDSQYAKALELVS